MATLPLLRELDAQKAQFVSTLDRLASLKNSVNNEYSGLQIKVNKKCFNERPRTTLRDKNSKQKNTLKTRTTKKDSYPREAHQTEYNKDPNKELFSIKKIKVVTERINDDNYHFEGRQAKTTRRNITKPTSPTIKKGWVSSRI